MTDVVDVNEKALIWNDRDRKTKVLDRYYAGIDKEAYEKIDSVVLAGARTYNQLD